MDLRNRHPLSQSSEDGLDTPPGPAELQGDPQALPPGPPTLNNHQPEPSAPLGIPQHPIRRGWRWKTFLKILIFLSILYATPVVVIYYSSWVKDAMIYVHHVKTPFFGNYSDPASFEMKTTRELELVHDDGCVIQVWQVLTSHYHHSEGFLSDVSYTRALSDGSPIILYMHGNTGTRATHHRVQLYKYLAEVLNYHVVTFDYRGFANSECYPSERGMMEDGGLVWRWLRETAPSARVYIWGHSLGSAAATHLTKELCLVDDVPVGLILDAPFPSMILAAEVHPFSFLYRPIMSIFSRYVLQSFEEKFESAKRLEYVRSPIVILHGELDLVVPFHLGWEMYEAALRSREKDPSLGRVDFVNCGEAGHKNNWEMNQAKEALKRFVLP